MRTDDLIRTLVLDHAPVRPWSGRALAVALAVGGLLAAIMLAVELGLRPDIAEAARDPRFIMKFVDALALAASAFSLAILLARPGAPIGWWWLALLAGPAVLAASVVAELLLVPASAWGARMIGENSRTCLTWIPLMSVPVLAAALWALRGAAPTRPAATGAVAGLLAGGIAAGLYAAHCPDDSPLFVATWYTLAIALVALAGALIGWRVLRW
jgi:hypothetical protein